MPRTSPSAVPLDSPAAGLKFRWERLHPLLVVALQLLAVAAASVLPVRSLQTVRRRP